MTSLSQKIIKINHTAANLNPPSKSKLKKNRTYNKGGRAAIAPSTAINNIASPVEINNGDPSIDDALSYLAAVKERR